MYDIEYLYQAEDVKDAIRALGERPQAEIISGGSDVLIKIREGKLAGCSLVSIHNIKELKGIHMEEDGTIFIGPATSFSHITNNELIQRYIPVLGSAVDLVGGPQVRNIGTIGGNICNGVTSADSACSLFILNALIELTGPDGVRQIPIEEFYTGPGRTVRSHEEIMTAIRIRKKDYEGFSGHYIKYGKRNAMEISTLGCGVLVRLSEDQTKIHDVRIAYGVAAPTPIRCKTTEQSLTGESISSRIYDIIAQGTVGEVNPRSSWRASKEFRLQLVEELGKRALAQAIISGGGKADA